MRTVRNEKRGFTLVEVIVVLVILAILAAIMIPAMTGWIDRAKQKRLVVACRTCVLAAQTLVTEQYGVDGTVHTPSSGDIIALAGVPGTASVDSFFTEDPTRIHKLTYSDGTDSVQYDADACGTGEYFIFNAGGAHSLGNTTDMDTIKASFAESFKNAGGQLDSGAANATFDASRKDIFAPQAVKDLAANGIDLATLGATTWKYYKDSSGLMLEWTSSDVSTMQVGDSITIMRYRMDGTYAGKYSVWEAKVGTGATGKTQDVTFNSIGNVGKQLTSGGTDYDTALAIYNKNK